MMENSISRDDQYNSQDQLEGLGWDCLNQQTPDHGAQYRASAHRSHGSGDLPVILVRSFASITAHAGQDGGQADEQAGCACSSDIHAIAKYQGGDDQFSTRYP